MLNDIKSCNIIYGYIQDSLLNYNNSTIILVEPRKAVIDKINRLKLNNIILIKKALVSKNSLSETVLYYDKINNNYWVDKNDLSINGTNFFNITKESVYTISLLDIISKYKIQNINNLVLNINITNNKQVLESIYQFNHIISYINIKTDFKCNLFNNFYNEKDEKSEYIIYIHKNLKLILPKIGICFNNIKTIVNIDKLELLIKQYQMSLIIKQRDIIEFPDSINKLNKIYNEIKVNNKKENCDFFHENIIQNLDIIFNINNDIIENLTETNNNLDIIIHFNPKYFEAYNTLQIMYPLKNNIIYINKMYDVIYGGKNCMYMLYQIIKSKYFSDYLDNKKSVNPKLFKIMTKRYFYEYIGKIFYLKFF
jgi:hypothetical protein